MILAGVLIALVALVALLGVCSGEYYRLRRAEQRATAITCEWSHTTTALDSRHARPPAWTMLLTAMAVCALLAGVTP